MKKRKNQEFSLFEAPIKNTKPIAKVELSLIYELIKSNEYKKRTEKLRAMQDKEKARKYKAENFDYCTFSGTFQTRKNDALREHSGLLCLDFDDLKNLDKLRKKLLNDEYLETRLLFRSPSGNGLKWIIQIDITKVSHGDYFRAVANYILKTYGVEVDKSGKDVSRACFLSHDPDAVYNPASNEGKKTFNPTDWLDVEQTADETSDDEEMPKSKKEVKRDIEMATQNIEVLGIDIAPKYDDWYKLGFALVSALGEDGRSYYHRISRFYPKYTKKETDKQFDECLKSHAKKGSENETITIGTFYHLAEQAGVDVFQLPKKAKVKPIAKFPTAGMPKFLEKFSAHIADVYGVPIEFPAISLISAFATAVGDKAMLDTPPFINYPQFWFVIVAPSGTGKSEPLSVAYEPIGLYQEIEFYYFEEALKEWKKAKENGETLPFPKQLRRTCNDFTPEALFALLASNPAITLYRDELAGHFEDIGRYNKSGEIGHWLSCFNNKGISIDRKGDDKPTLISKPILSMIGTIQPQKLYEIASEKSMRGNGYLQRFLFVFPDDVKCPMYSRKTVNNKLLQQYDEMLDKLLHKSEVDTYTLGKKAQKMYEEFCNEMAGLINGTEDDNLKSLYAKMKIHILRLALTLSIIDSLDDEDEDEDEDKEVSAEIMKYAVALCGYFIETGKKIHIPPPPPTLTRGSLYRQIEETIGIKNQTKFAESLDVSLTAVSKALKRVKK